MTNAGNYGFSFDSENYVYCGNDGKLKIYDTGTSRLKQEYVPDSHLSSPRCVLTWLHVNSRATNTSPSPWKKRRKKSISEEPSQKNIIAMGLTSGKIILYDTTTCSVTAHLDGHSGTITALTWSENVGLFSAADDQHIIQWNLQENGVKYKWQTGTGKTVTGNTTSLAISVDGKSLFSGERVIKWWNLSTRHLIKKFTGHENQITCLCTIKTSGVDYIISGACNNYLKVWKLDEERDGRTPVINLALQDDPISVSTNVSVNSRVTILVVTRSGQADLFQFLTNNLPKSLKPNLTIKVASDTSQNDSIQQSSILDAKLMEDLKLLLVHGTYINPVFEKITPDFSKGVQFLIRSESKRKKEEISKVKSVVIENNVEYLTPGIVETTLKRFTKNSGSQLLLQDRLDNLSLNAESDETGKTASKGNNRAQLLIQGLNSKDKTILNNVFLTKNESIIRNTIAKLPIQAIGPLLKELTILLQGKTFTSKIAVRWLEALLTTHAGHLLAQPDLMESFGPILSFIDAKLTLLAELSKLKGRVSLVTGQISQTVEEQDKGITENCLVYQDSDSSDEDGGIEDEDVESESDEKWDEISSQDEDMEDGQEEHIDEDVYHDELISS